MMTSMLAAASSLRLVLFWLYFTGARCAGVVSAEGPVSLTTASLSTSLHPPTSTLSSSKMTTASVSVAPLPTQSTFFFNTISNMTTCTPGIISWNYSGSSVNLSLSITNVVDPYSSGNLTRRQSTAGTNLSVILADINATSNSWTWPQVNVSQGWYQGTVSPLSAVSAAFFISNGSDTSCLLGSSSSSSATLDTGEIIGIVLGALAGLGVIVVAVAYYYLRRRPRCSPPRGNQRRRQTKENMGRWDSLKSNHSTVRSQSEGNAGETSTAQSDATGFTGESLADTTSLAEEKVVPNHLSNPSPPSSYDRRTPLANYRRHSELQFEQQATRIRSSMESSMYTHTERFSLPAFPRSPTSPRSLSAFPNRELDEYPASLMDTTSHRGRDEYPPSPVATDTSHRGRDEFPPATSTSRSPSASTTTRRAPRKPVPHFDLSELHDLKGGSQDAQPTIISDDVSPPPHDTPVLSDRINFRNHSRMHYLIPDMPPPGNK